MKTIRRRCDYLRPPHYPQRPAPRKTVRVGQIVPDFQITLSSLRLTCVSLTCGTLTTLADCFLNLSIGEPSSETDRRPTPLPSRLSR